MIIEIKDVASGEVREISLGETDLDNIAKHRPAFSPVAYVAACVEVDLENLCMIETESTT